MGNTLRWTSLPSVCLLLLLAGQSRADITCKAVTSDTETTVTCDFGTHLKNSFNVHFFYPDIHAQPDPTLACNRLTSGELTCQYGGGVKFDEKQVGSTITLTGPPATDKTGGKYVCQSVPPLNVPNEPCTLTYQASPETGTGDSGNARDHGHYTLSLVTLIVVVLLFAAFVFYVLHKKQVRKRERHAPTQDENATQAMLTPVPNTTQEKASPAGGSSVDVSDHGSKSAAVSIEMHESKSDPAPSESEPATPPISPYDGAKAPGATEEGDVLRVMILGNTDTEKSRTGNTLLGRDVFKHLRHPKRCQWAVGEVNKVILQITDTYFPEDKYLLEICKSLALTSPGPHVVLMTIRCDKPFDDKCYRYFETLKNNFGENIKDFMIVVFTGLDRLANDKKKQETELEQWKKSGYVKRVLEDVENRCIGFNNFARGRHKQEQVNMLVDKMKELKKERGGRFFQNKFSLEVDQLVASLMKVRRENYTQNEKEAEKNTKEAIAKDKEGQDFYTKLLNIVRRRNEYRTGSPKQNTTA